MASDNSQVNLGLTDLDPFLLKYIINLAGGPYLNIGLRATCRELRAKIPPVKEMTQSKLYVTCYLEKWTPPLSTLHFATHNPTPILKTAFRLHAVDFIMEYLQTCDQCDFAIRPLMGAIRDLLLGKEVECGTLDPHCIVEVVQRYAFNELRSVYAYALEADSVGTMMALINDPMQEDEKNNHLMSETVFHDSIRCKATRIFCHLLPFRLMADLDDFMDAALLEDLSFLIALIAKFDLQAICIQQHADLTNILHIMLDYLSHDSDTPEHRDYVRYVITKMSELFLLSNRCYASTCARRRCTRSHMSNRLICYQHTNTRFDLL